MIAHYDHEQRELSLRLESDESEEDFRRLGVLLVQFLDRRLRRTGDAINAAMSSERDGERDGEAEKKKERPVRQDRSE
jgi:hypothetical protein